MMSISPLPIHVTVEWAMKYAFKIGHIAESVPRDHNRLYYLEHELAIQVKNAYPMP